MKYPGWELDALSEEQFQELILSGIDEDTANEIIDTQIASLAEQATDEGK